MKRTERILLMAACCLMMWVAGCATFSSHAKQETLEERVKNYMQAQVEGQWDHAYSFFHPAYREKLSKEEYLQRTRKVSYKGFSIEEITVPSSGNEATVKVRIDLLFMGMIFPRAPEKQNWIKQNGEWFMKSSDKMSSLPSREKQS